MKRFISTTTTLAMILASGPTLPLMAQDFVQAEINGQIVLCLPNKKAECPEGALCTVANDPAKCDRAATKFLESLAGGEMTPAEGQEVITQDALVEPNVAEQPKTEKAPAKQKKEKAEAPVENATEVVPDPVVVIADPALTKAAPAEAALNETTPAAFAAFVIMIGDQAVLCLPDKSVKCPADQVCTVSTKQANCEANAIKRVAKLAPVESVALDAAQIDALGDILGTPAGTDAAAIGAVTAEKTDAVVTEEVLTQDDTRSATEEFDAVPTEVAPGKKSGLSNLEIAGLAVLGTLAVGVLLKDHKRVVENTGDRVVVEDADGNYNIYKDDNALLRQPGTTMRTETFSDGSTRTVSQRADGSQIVTIRDATGRVLQRSSYNAQGVETQLIDDLSPERVVDVKRLPKAKANGISENSTLAEIRAEVDRVSRENYAHSFSLRQVREIRQVRDLAPTIDVNNVTFDSGSSAIKKSEARKLERLGRLMNALIKQNPGEVFLVEGHTDAVGRGSYNLTLSDRRAESVARALTEFYGVPAENLVVQGYGEKELKIDSQKDERQNRRAVVRIISPLLKLSAR